MYSRNIGESMQHLYEEIDEEDEGYLIIGGDLLMQGQNVKEAQYGVRGS